jgi:hypothetical protein
MYFFDIAGDAPENVLMSLANSFELRLRIRQSSLGVGISLERSS